MLGVRSVGELAAVLKTTPRRMFDVAARKGDHVRRYELVDPAKPHKAPRPVLSTTGPYRQLQTQILRGLLGPRLRPSPYSFGGIAGRNAVQNARQHLGSSFVFTTDIRNFFPSINFWQVRDTFERRFRCPPDVALLLATLCTHDGHLAQGLMTSPILADHAVRRIDARIGGLCDGLGLVYTRFVDDVTVSGRFGLDKTESAVVRLIRQILGESGFAVALHKEQDGRLSDGEVAVTGYRQLRSRLDVASDYIRGLERSLESHRLLGLGEPFHGLLFTRDQLAGRVAHVCNANRNRTRPLSQQLAAIDWDGVRANAEARGLLVCRKQLRPV